MPSFPIIDTHVHFWDGGRVPLSWQAGSAIDRPFLPADLFADAGAVNVEGVVFVEAAVDEGHHLAEADFVRALAADEPRIRAIVAHAPMSDPAVGRDLETLAANPLLRGVRDLIQGRDAGAMCGNAAFRDGLRRLPALGLHFELCILHHQLGAVLKLVEALPEVSFVLDHIAKPGIAAGLRDPWWDEIAALAANENVTCKISGVATEADHASWRDEELLPYVERVVEVFGPQRLLFGSDWPVMRLAISYPRWVEIVDAAIAPLTEAERRLVYEGNARRVYRL